MRLNSLKSTWNEYKGWFFLAFGAYALWSFRGVFSAFGNTAGALAEQATAKLQLDARAAADTQKVKAATGKATTYTQAQLDTFKADASSLAHMLGRDSFGMASIFPNFQAAFSLLKNSYSRLLLSNNKPFSVVVVRGKKTYPNSDKELPGSVKRATNWRVLVPFYSEATGGRDLLSDLRSDLDKFVFRPAISWII
jgi:hypothetical protein